MTGKLKLHWKRLKGSTPSESGLTDFNAQLKFLGHWTGCLNGQVWTECELDSLFDGGQEFRTWVPDDDDSERFNPIVLTQIELPTGESYRFTYDIYGLIEQIKYPTGGIEQFEYNPIPVLNFGGEDPASGLGNFGVRTRSLKKNESDQHPYEWEYAAHVEDPNGYVIRITNPDLTKTERFIYRNGGCGTCKFGYSDPLSGMVYKEKSFDSSDAIVSARSNVWNVNYMNVSYGGYPGEAMAGWHPRLANQKTIVYDSLGNGVSTTTAYEYAGNLYVRETPVLVNRSTQFAFEPIETSNSIPELPGEPPSEPPAPGPGPTPNPNPGPMPVPQNSVKTVDTTYLIYDPNYAGIKGYYTAQNMVGLVTASEVKDEAGTIISRSETVFDDVANFPLVNAGMPIQWTNPNHLYRGNPNSAKVWDSTKGASTNPAAYISTHAQFDTYGNQVKAWDAKGNYTTTTFDTTYYAYPVQSASPVPDPSGQHGSTASFVTTVTFNTVTGLPLKTTDANRLETSIEYDPVTLRPLNTKTYYGGNQVGSMSETIYHDEPKNYWVKNRSQIDTNRWAETITYFDGLGRAWKTEEINSNGNIFVEKEFDAEGRVKRVSNPFRAGESKVWTTNVYDEASRVREVILQDGSTVKTDYGVSISGVVGITKQITDQAGKKRKGISDALGRMVRVIEDPAGQALNTDYVFDTLGNLRKTTQGEQNRYFMHDSLGRLLYAKQPEQDTRSSFVATDPITGNTAWSVKYEYDDNGNITRTTDAGGIYIDGIYDNLNRLKVRDYSDPETPDVSFFYDGRGLGAEPARSKGKTTKVTSSVSETRYTSFDELGRLKSHQQITEGQTYSTGYEYNLSGGLVKETYPSGRTVQYDISADGDLSKVWGQNGAAVTTYANAFSYNASGAITAMKLGNGKWETAQYNNRIQITQIGLGSSAVDTGLLKLELGYGDSTQNNGSLRSQKIGFAGLANSFEQTYTYDDLNRLKVAEEKVAGATTWKQTFDIDRYGNRRFDTNEGDTTTLGSCSEAICNPTISTATNRISESGYVFDANGSLTQNAAGERFAYDAENHQKEFFAAGNGSNTPDATYFYDGDGRRIKKVTATETTVFVYNASGQLVAEYSTQVSQTPQVSYLTTDHLGSPRVITDEFGAVKDRKDYSAFGEETISAQRHSSLGYNAADEIRKGYTGYEKDNESGLDFAQARYYNSIHGRYTSVDPLTASASIRNPQTFNRYSYVLNSPYKYTDPLGLLPVSVWGGTGCGAEYSSCDENGRGIGIDEHADRIYQEEIARLKANQAFARGDTDEGWRIIRESEGALMALDQNGNAVQDPNVPSGTAGSSENSASSQASQDDDTCSGVDGFSSAIGGFSAQELNDAAVTVFGEISAVLPANLDNLWAEAWVVASVIFNRSDAVRNGTQGNNPFGATASLTDVVKASAQFAGYAKGLADVRRGMSRANEMFEGQRNCIRLYYAIEAVRRLASGERRAPFLFFVSNFRGTRTLQPGQFRYGGNDFSRNPISRR